MPNIHGLHSNARDSSDSEDEAENRYVGGIGAQGGGRCVSWYLFAGIAAFVFGIVMCRMGLQSAEWGTKPIQDTAARRSGKRVWIPSFDMWKRREC